MRASSLANDKVISLINRYYVPVYISNEDYARTGSAPADEGVVWGRYGTKPFE